MRAPWRVRGSAGGFRAMIAVATWASLASGCLSYEKFLQKKHDKYCEELAKCNPDIPCEQPEATDTGYGTVGEDCDFDGGAAHDCLNGVWTCNNDFVGFEYPIGPQACEAVCGVL